GWPRDRRERRRPVGPADQVGIFPLGEEPRLRARLFTSPDRSPPKPPPGPMSAPLTTPLHRSAATGAQRRRTFVAQGGSKGPGRDNVASRPADAGPFGGNIAKGPVPTVGRRKGPQLARERTS